MLGWAVSTHNWYEWTEDELVEGILATTESESTYTTTFALPLPADFTQRMEANMDAYFAAKPRGSRKAKERFRAQRREWRASRDFFLLPIALGGE